MRSRDPYSILSEAIATRPALPPSRRAPSCYVALGDSFTAGTGCGAGEGWADRLANAIRAHHGELTYRNLAADGATSADVLDQLAKAIELEPDLVSVVCGANDVLRSTRPDAVAYAERLGSVFRRLRAAGRGPRIVTATSPERWDFLELGPRTRARVMRGLRRLNDATRRVAELHDVPYLEVAAHPGLSESAHFSADGLHPSSLGHARAARAFARLLRERFGIGTDFDGDAP
jgi:lysophospholipase L1-like esterase